MRNNYPNNAFKFTKSGEIVVRVRASEEDGQTAVFRFEVADTGTGFKPVLHDHIFSRFTQADSSTTRRFGGTGLGLALCKEFAELMGGDAFGLPSALSIAHPYWPSSQPRL